MQSNQQQGRLAFLVLQIDVCSSIQQEWDNIVGTVIGSKK
jgi:hypothetical protein